MMRIERIIQVLEEGGPMPAREVSTKSGVDYADTCKLILLHRQQAGYPNVRFCGKVREGTQGKNRLNKVYEVSDADDEDESHVIPSINDIKITDEAAMRAAWIKRLAAKIRPFRDPMIFLTAGRAP